MARKKINRCSFCGRDEHEVALLITGMDGFICSDCVKQAYNIIQTVDKKPGEAAPTSQPSGMNMAQVPKPQEIKEYLDQGGQGDIFDEEGMSVSCFFARKKFGKKPKRKENGRNIILPLGDVELGV